MNAAILLSEFERDPILAVRDEGVNYLPETLKFYLEIPPHPISPPREGRGEFESVFIRVHPRSMRFSFRIPNSAFVCSLDSSRFLGYSQNILRN